MATIDDVYNLLVTVDGKIDAIKAKTDQLNFVGDDVKAVSGDTGVSLSGERFEDFPETEY